MNEAPLLLTDLYQLTMLQAYHDEGMNDAAVFEFFVRKLPESRNFLVAAGLEPVPRLSGDGALLRPGAGLAAPLGTIPRRFPGRPGRLAFHRRRGRHGRGHGVLPRRAHPARGGAATGGASGGDAPHQPVAVPDPGGVQGGALRAGGTRPRPGGLRPAPAHGAGRACCRRGQLSRRLFRQTATVLAGMRWDIPLYGTMAHSFVQAHDAEEDAFVAFARSHRRRHPAHRHLRHRGGGAMPGHTGARAGGGRVLAGGGAHRQRRLAEHARRVRAILDAAGCMR